ncbi:MAG: DinB family protein [Caldilineaceae bacterium]
MNDLYKKSLWQQFGAAIDTLDTAINACPEALWNKPVWPPDIQGISDFWYLAYHTLFWLDFYLSGGSEDFAPPAPFTLSEFDPAGLLPDRVYTKGELQHYLQYCRQKCFEQIHMLTDVSANRLCLSGKREKSYFEVLLYNMRHVQEHTAQLNLLLGQKGVPVVDWVSRAKE